MEKLNTELSSLRKVRHDEIHPDRDSESPEDSLVISDDIEGKGRDDDEIRGHWGNDVEFFLAIVGYTVGAGSFWRFPIICRSSTMCVIISGFSSFFNGLVVFTILGFIAKDAGLSVQEVATQSGPGLTFVVFPIALSKMPFPQLWSVLFFLMLTTVVFDSAFGMLETVSSGIVDFFPKQLTSKRILVNIAVGVFMILTGIPLCLNSGIYVFQLADWYFSQFAILIGSLFECVAVCWIYDFIDEKKKKKRKQEMSVELTYAPEVNACLLYVHTCEVFFLILRH